MYLTFDIIQALILTIILIMVSFTISISIYRDMRYKHGKDLIKPLLFIILIYSLTIVGIHYMYVGILSIQYNCDVCSNINMNYISSYSNNSLLEIRCVNDTHYSEVHTINNKIYSIDTYEIMDGGIK